MTVGCYKQISTIEESSGIKGKLTSNVDFHCWRCSEGHYRVFTDPGNPGYPGKTLEFKSILEFLEKPWNCVENPGKITLQSIFVDICQYFNHLVRQDL